MCGGHPWFLYCMSLYVFFYVFLLVLFPCWLSLE